MFLSLGFEFTGFELSTLSFSEHLRIYFMVFETHSFLSLPFAVQLFLALQSLQLLGTKAEMLISGNSVSGLFFLTLLLQDMISFWGCTDKCLPTFLVEKLFQAAHINMCSIHCICCHHCKKKTPTITRNVTTLPFLHQ